MVDAKYDVLGIGNAIFDVLVQTDESFLVRHGMAKGYCYPKIAPQASRRDSWPPNGGVPGSDLAFCQEQHLDFYGIDHAILTPLGAYLLAKKITRSELGAFVASLAYSIAPLQRRRAHA